mmetsp:Transcript_62797/g.120919  ORF Transcript_62797/g.120919 Transcript_62797/m.120919 type:complete len:209 (-) Transcript_62797:3-629(-)
MWDVICSAISSASAGSIRPFCSKTLSSMNFSFVRISISSETKAPAYLVFSASTVALPASSSQMSASSVSTFRVAFSPYSFVARKLSFFSSSTAFGSAIASGWLRVCERPSLKSFCMKATLSVLTHCGWVEAVNVTSSSGLSLLFLAAINSVASADPPGVTSSLPPCCARTDLVNEATSSRSRNDITPSSTTQSQRSCFSVPKLVQIRS